MSEETNKESANESGNPQLPKFKPYIPTAGSAPIFGPVTDQKRISHAIATLDSNLRFEIQPLLLAIENKLIDAILNNATLRYADDECISIALSAEVICDNICRGASTEFLRDRITMDPVAVMSALRSYNEVFLAFKTLRDYTLKRLESEASVNTPPADVYQQMCGFRWDLPFELEKRPSVVSVNANPLDVFTFADVTFVKTFPNLSHILDQYLAGLIREFDKADCVPMTQNYAGPCNPAIQISVDESLKLRISFMCWFTLHDCCNDIVDKARVKAKPLVEARILHDKEEEQ